MCLLRNNDLTNNIESTNKSKRPNDGKNSDTITELTYNRNRFIAHKQMCLLRNINSPSKTKTANKSKRPNKKEKLKLLLKSATKTIFNYVKNIQQTILLSRNVVAF